ncbi:MAG: VirB8/TrbF family protein, partial [Rickettsiaceae bacterium]|nr:VirB8/TrbF family protein [Rickettsiaceae bacterium]
MLKINELINKFKNSDSANNPSGTTENTQTKSTKEIRNWYEERFDNITVQRNLLFILLIVLLCLSIISIGVIAYVINTKRFDPFVIQIDDTTGMAKVVNPINSQVLNGNEALAQYFIKKYVVARETYNPVDFTTLANKTVRLLSANSI